jgi:aryl-alcohol dehydrogenase-like predicted oxidoreductase
MKFNQLGNSGLLVSDISLGTMVFGEGRERSTPANEAQKMIHRYLEAGGNHIDTADGYAGGRSEEIVGQALRGHPRDQVVVATKVYFPTGDGRNDIGLSRHHIIEAVNASLRRLDMDYIDLYYMHRWDHLTPLAESLRAFDDLVQAGKVRYIGVSNFKAWQAMKGLALSDAQGWTRFVAGQYQYSLIKRDIEYEFIDLCQSEGIGLTPWAPLGGGFLSGKYQRGQRPSAATEGRLALEADRTEDAWARRNTERNWQVIDAVGKIAEAREATYSQIALAWLRAQPTVSSIIMGVRTIDQLEDNLGAATIDLTDDELASLATASTMPELYPYRFIADMRRRVANP